MGYSVEELTVSKTAEREGLSNLPATEIHESNLRLLGRFLESLPFEFRINSAYRSPEVNTAVAGAKTSQHMNALGLDLSPTGLSNKELATWLWAHRAEYPELDQVIWYTDTSHVHIGICPSGGQDCRSGAPRQAFYSARNEAGSYSRWEPTADEMAEVMALYPQGRPWNWRPLIYIGVGAGVVGLVFLAFKIRQRR